MGFHQGKYLLRGDSLRVSGSEIRARGVRECTRQRQCPGDENDSQVYQWQFLYRSPGAAGVLPGKWRANGTMTPGGVTT
jgi:hypothetical protein